MPPFSISDDILKRTVIFVFLGTAVVIVSAYALFLLQNILIIFPADHPLPLAVAIEIALLVPVLIVLLWRYLEDGKGILPLAGIIIILWLAPQATFILDIEAGYRTIEKDYRMFAKEQLQAGDDKSATAWNISTRYLDSFSSSGNDIRNPVPVRSIFPGNGVYRFHLLLYHYLFDMNGLEKLTAVDGRGNCSEYARAVAFLVNRTMDIPTRFVIMYGYDHKFAEALTEEGWIVLDPLKTIDRPVRAEYYSEYLRNSNRAIYEKVTGICSADGENLSSAHGF
ncbi:transglutaminase domain protein [Methanolacinia petrolearia DSM 11571]|uniref:Transglutaminase domain protein n=1 Tax=Methanolacinia petrolearia (strain DSM 11571 / OCM 486 / SEBR 4847) TaxID=679926 RepID=E1RJ95_METP4|nr:transglutaminase domain-containing protein [Methanolacinia petrolearia]ADN35613.1 transglutaminase domain protein [Methanolacinia petrolearia DSM 11571]